MGENFDPYIKIAEKLEQELCTSDETSIPAEPITAYLLMRCTQCAELGALIMQPNKTLKKCFAYVHDYVYKQSAAKLKRQHGWLNDQEVYDIAEAYFRLDDAEIERQKSEANRKTDEIRERGFSKVVALPRAADDHKGKAAAEEQLSFMEVIGNAAEAGAEKAAA